MNFEIAEPTEIEEINRLIESSKRYWGYSDELMEVWQRDLLVTRKDLNSRTFWLMKINTEMVGVFSLSLLSEGIFELEDFWLNPSAIGNGLGRKMFQFMIHCLQSTEATKLVIVSDPHAEGFYKKMGATRVKFVNSKPEGRMLPVMDLLLPGNQGQTTFKLATNRL